jgi:kumamolisin
MVKKMVEFQGSRRSPKGTRVGEVPLDEMLTVSVILKAKTRAAVPVNGERAMSRESFAEAYGATHDSVERVKQFAAERALHVLEESHVRRTVRLEGTAEAFAEAFGTQFDRYEHEGKHYRARTGAIQVPEEIAGSIEAVLGLDNRPQARPYARVHGTPEAVANVSYTPRQVAQLYSFPLDADGSGQTIGILELGGGYRAADLKNYFASMNIKEPSVTAVLVDGGKNHSTNANSADGEVLLDIEVAGAVAPGAKIVVYFAPNTDQGFLDALTTAIHDKQNKPSVISISWGGPEIDWTSQAMIAFDAAARDAALLGITICAASGDNGSSDNVKDGKNHVDFPASSPHILACGGTNLQSKNGVITSETVWNDSTAGGAAGGGFSVQFPMPDYQTSAQIKGTGRGVPDVCGDADPETGYQVLVDGHSTVIGGTSAVAPLWSGLTALLNQKLGAPVGFLQPKLYALHSSTGAFRDITAGSNGTFSAGSGWDPASGLGSPSGQNLLKAL